MSRKEWWIAIALVVGLRAGSLLGLYVGWKFIPRADYGVDLWMTRPGTAFIDNLANFDGAWYARLAALGYRRLAAQDYNLAAETARLRVMDQLGFEQGRWPPEPASTRFDRGYGFRHWPLLVWMIEGACRLGLDPVRAGVVLSNLLSLAYGLLLYRLAREDFDSNVAVLAVALSQLHPGAYSLSGLYNESLFLVASAAAMLSARQRRFGLAGLMGLAACLSRICGFVLIGPLVYEWMLQRSEAAGGNAGFAGVLGPENLKRTLRGLVEWPGLWWAALLPLGTLIVLAYFQIIAGDAMIWTRVHEANVYGHVNWPWLMLLETYHKGWQVWMKELPLHGLLLLVILLSLKRVRGSYWLWMALFFVYHTSNGNHSYLRYQVQCLPLFLALAELLAGTTWLAAVALGTSAALFGVFGAMFINGYWVA